MNILILTENYTKGGLETQIATYYNELKRRNSIFFCVGKYEDNGLLPNAKIEQNFHFSYDVTIEHFVEDVQRLVNIIKQNKIDVINVHPFYGIYQAVFAAQLTGTKLVYSYHGPLSSTFTLNLVDEILFEYAFETSVASVNSVSIVGVQSFEKIAYKNNILLPNPVDTDKYKETRICDNKKWALVSRLDTDKSDAIEKLFNNIDKIDIAEIDVWGDGNEKTYLEEIASRARKKITFKGYAANINDVLLNNYNGVIGIGRAAIEGLSMGYPVMLVGNGKICGIIDSELFEKLKIHNFAGRKFRDLPVDILNNQLKDVYTNKNKYVLRQEVKDNFDIKNIANKYLDNIKSLDDFVPNKALIDFYNELKECDAKMRFHDEYYLLDLIDKYITYNTETLTIKNLIMILKAQKKENDTQKINLELIKEHIRNSDSNIEDLIEKNRELEDRSKFLEKKIEQYGEYSSSVEWKVDFLSENISSKWIIRNNLRKLILKSKRKK